MRALAVVMLAVALFAPAATRAAADSALGASPTADAVLREARRAFRAVVRPPFVVYTISRDERRFAMNVLEERYHLRVWYRASDGGALQREIGNRGARGPLVYVKPRFNAPLDPGPPTADIFEPAPDPRAPQDFSAGDPLKTIGTVTVPVENDYRATFERCEPTCYHLRLQPRRDAERNRLREMWVEREGYRVTRFTATDRLFYGGTGVVVPQIFDVTMDAIDGIPVVRSIRSRAAGFDPYGSSFDRDDYEFTDVVFPASLPDWYFRPETYGAHVAQAPEH